MKAAFNFIAIGLVAVILANTSCQKEYSCENCREKKSPPVANAGPDQAIALPKDSVLLDGALSNDPDGARIYFLVKM